MEYSELDILSTTFEVENYTEVSNLSSVFRSVLLFRLSQIDRFYLLFLLTYTSFEYMIMNAETGQKIYVFTLLIIYMCKKKKLICQSDDVIEIFFK